MSVFCRSIAAANSSFSSALQCIFELVDMSSDNCKDPAWKYCGGIDATSRLKQYGMEFAVRIFKHIIYQSRRNITCVEDEDSGGRTVAFSLRPFLFHQISESVLQSVLKCLVDVINKETATPVYVAMQAQAHLGICTVVTWTLLDDRLTKLLRGDDIKAVSKTVIAFGDIALDLIFRLCRSKVTFSMLWGGVPVTTDLILDFQDAMAHIWKSSIADRKRAIGEHPDLIFYELLIQCGSSLWQPRDASSLAIADILQGHKFNQWSLWGRDKKGIVLKKGQHTHKFCSCDRLGQEDSHQDRGCPQLSLQGSRKYQNFDCRKCQRIGMLPKTHRQFFGIKGSWEGNENKFIIHWLRLQDEKYSVPRLPYETTMYMAHVDLAADLLERWPTLTMATQEDFQQHEWDYHGSLQQDFTQVSRLALRRIEVSGSYWWEASASTVLHALQRFYGCTPRLDCREKDGKLFLLEVHLYLNSRLELRSVPSNNWKKGNFRDDATILF
ncbi:hypothetical protein OROHE_017455 [Orobanche hederae]